MSELTLKNLFFSAAEDPGAGGVVDGNLEPDDEVLVALKSDIKEQLPRLSFKAVEKEMSAKIGEVLNVGIDEVLVSAWKKYRGFQEYADPTKHPPEETILVPLAKHTIKSSHKPHVDLLIKEILIGSIHLEVKLALDLEGIVLKVQAGKIWDVRAGSCRASGSLKCSLKSKYGAKDVLSLKRETKKFELRGAVKLGDGIAIPQRQDQPSKEDR